MVENTAGRRRLLGAAGGGGGGEAAVVGSGGEVRPADADAGGGDGPPERAAAGVGEGVGLSDVGKLWGVLMSDVGHHNSAAWLDHFELRSLDAGVSPALATLVPRRRGGHVSRFATGPRLERLGHHLTRLSGSAVRVVLAAADGGGAGLGEGDAGSGGGRADGGGDGVDRRDALSLPLVRDAFEAFPDAILVDARKERVAEAPAEAVREGEESAGAGADGEEPESA